MAKQEVRCCQLCGRDTFGKTGICYRCYGLGNCYAGKDVRVGGVMQSGDAGHIYDEDEMPASEAAYEGTRILYFSDEAG